MEYNLKCIQNCAKPDSHFIKRQWAESLHYIGVTGWFKAQYRPLKQCGIWSSTKMKTLDTYYKNMFSLSVVKIALCLSYNNGIKIWACIDCVKARKWRNKNTT